MTRHAVWPADVTWDPALGASPAVTAGGWIFTSNHLPSDFRAALVAEARADERNPFGHSPLERESDYVLAALARTLAAAGGDLKTSAVRIYWWLRSDRPTLDDFAAGKHSTGFDDLTPIHEARERHIADPSPGSTGIGVRQLLAPAATIAAALIGLQTASGLTTEELRPAAELGHIPDSPGVRAGDWIFTVGVIASDWQGDFMATEHRGEPSFLHPRARVNPYIWFGSAVEAQVDFMLETLAAIAAEAGTSLDRCVKAEVYYGHPQDLYAIERSWRRAFPKRPPARTLMPYAGLAGAGCRVEISLTLLAGDNQIEVVETSSAPEPFWHEPQAVKAGDLLFLSNQFPIDKAGRVPRHLTADAEFPHLHNAARGQARQILENVAAICDAAGTSVDQVCRRASFYDDLGHFSANVAEWSDVFVRENAPASIDVGLGSCAWPLAVPDAHLMVDVIAYCPPR